MKSTLRTFCDDDAGQPLPQPAAAEGDLWIGSKHPRSSPCWIKIRNPKNRTGNQRDQVLATTYMQAVQEYGLNAAITPGLRPDGERSGDQAQFWDRDFAAIWIIEDDYGNWNEENYHSTTDVVSTINMPYCTAITKATLAAAAHLAIPNGY